MRIQRATNEEIVLVVAGVSYNIPIEQKVNIDFAQDGSNDANVEYSSLHGNVVTLMFKRIAKDRVKVAQESPLQQKQPSEEWALQEEQQPEDKAIPNGKKRSLRGMLLKVCIGLFVTIALFAGRRYLQSGANKKSRRKNSNI